MLLQQWTRWLWAQRHLSPWGYLKSAIYITHETIPLSGICDSLNPESPPTLTSRVLALGPHVAVTQYSSCLFCLDFYAYPGSFHSLSCSQLPPCSDGSWISTCVQSFLLSSSPCYPTFFWIFLPQLQHAHNQAQLSSKSVSSFFFHI